MTEIADIVVVGALAYDQIADTARPLDVQSLRNAKLTSLRRDFGGCGGNLAYSCAKLGIKVLPVGTLGLDDADAYLKHLNLLNVPTDGLLQLGGTSAQGLVITDPNGDQFTGFYPGPSITLAQWQRHIGLLEPVLQHARYVIQAPFPAELTEHVLDRVAPMRTAGLTLVWCPGQYADMLSPQDISAMLPLVDLVVGNAWEIDYLERHIKDESTLLLKTDGSAPVSLRSAGKTLWSETVPEAPTVTDPTGCGDAFTAALVCALISEKLELTPANIRSVVPGAMLHAQRCLAVAGCQAF